MHATSSVLRVTFRKSGGVKVNLHRALPLNLPHTFTPRFEIFTPRVETFTPRMQIAVCKIAAVDVGLECISGIEVIEKS